MVKRTWLAVCIASFKHKSNPGPNGNPIHKSNPNPNYMRVASYESASEYFAS